MRGLLYFSSLLLPWFELKLLGILGLVWLFFSQKRAFNKSQTAIGLFFVFYLTFILSPYWHVVHKVPVFIYVLLGLLTAGGVFWAKQAASRLEIPTALTNVWPLVVITVILYVLMYIPLHSDIAWRGDENFHIKLLLNLINYIIYWWEQKFAGIITEQLWLVIIIFICSLWLIYRLRKRTLLAATVLLILLAVLLYPVRVFNETAHPLMLWELLRYPYIQKWLNLFFLFPDPYLNVGLYRFVPFVSLLFIAWICYGYLNAKIHNPLLALFSAIAFSSIPLMLFYSSILYLEMPVVLLSLIAALNIDIWIRQKSTTLTQTPVWYTLLLLGFFKETALFMLILFISLRLIFQLKNRIIKRAVRLVVFTEFRLYALMLSPGVAYLFFRSVFTTYSIFAANPPYEFRILNVFHLTYYIETMRQLFFQLGPLIFLGLGGVLFMWKRQRLWFWSYSFLFLGMLAFFLSYTNLDFTYSPDGIVYPGYSRWLLFIVAPVLSTALYGFTRLSRILQVVTIGALLIGNVLLMPFAPDGTRVPNWGAPNGLDVGEYTYPYSQAIQASKELRIQSLALAGLYSAYDGKQFYFNKYNYFPVVEDIYFGNKRISPAEEARELKKLALKINTKTKAQGILYHSINRIEVDQEVFSPNYSFVDKFTNAFHSLYLFVRTPHF